MPMMSARTQGMAAPGSTNDQAKSLFEQGLSSMAYNVLVNKLPNIMPDVVTFKILDSDSPTGAGVGAFVVMRRNQTIYIPVVMAENQIKPLDIMYYKDQNVFLPLNKEWLEEVDKLAIGEMGTSVTPPSTLETDVDIRNTVVPPTTGRYSYAAERAVSGAALLLDEARHQVDPKLAFLDFLEKAPNSVKEAALRIFEKHQGLLKVAVHHYGVDALRTALAQTKVADYGAKMSPTGALYIADKSTTPSQYKELFGPEAPMAFSGVATKGYFAKDNRTNVHSAVATETRLALQEPKESGAYKLWDTNGKSLLALVIGNPMDLFNDGPRGKRRPAMNIRFRTTSDIPAQPHATRDGYRSPGENPGTDAPYIARYVGVTENGKLFDMANLIGEAVPFGELEGSKPYKKIVAEAAAGPRKGQRGIFVGRRSSSFLGTTPVEIVSVSDLGDGRRIVVTNGMQTKTLVMQKSSPTSRIMIPAHGSIVYLPSDFVFMPSNDIVEANELLTDADDVMQWMWRGLIKEGAEKVVVKQSSHGFTFGSGSAKKAYEFVPALRELAISANLGVEDAAYALKQAAEFGRFECWTLPAAKLEGLRTFLKTAAGDPSGGGGKPPAEGGGSAEGGQDPAGDAMGQVMGAPMAPAAPAPVDMAVAEAMQNLMMQQTGLQQQMTLLQQIQQRTQMIAGGGGAMGSPAAAAAAMGGPMDPSMMGGGGPVMQPSAGGQPPMGGAPPMGQPAPQPGMGGGQPPMQGQPPQGQPQGQPGMAMQQGGGPQAAMSPMAGAQMGQQQQQQQPPQAMMNAEDGSVESIMNQINPQFLEQAGQLQDVGAFDAAALGSMAQTPGLKDLVGAYVPNLEKSLDNIGRVLLSLWMDENRIKEDIGSQTFIALEDNLRTVFRGLGDLILKVNQNTAIMRGPNESTQTEQ